VPKVPLSNIAHSRPNLKLIHLLMRVMIYIRLSTVKHLLLRVKHLVIAAQEKA